MAFEAQHLAWTNQMHFSCSGWATGPEAGQTSAAAARANTCTHRAPPSRAWRCRRALRIRRTFRDPSTVRSGFPSAYRRQVRTVSRSGGKAYVRVRKATTCIAAGPKQEPANAFSTLSTLGGPWHPRRRQASRPLRRTHRPSPERRRTTRSRKAPRPGVTKYAEWRSRTPARS